VIQTAITLVKANRIDEAEGQLRFALGHLRNRRDLPIVAACTEVPLAYIAGALPPEKMTSSLEALALSCLRELYGPKPPL
jgi:aspartate racemase